MEVPKRQPYKIAHGFEYRKNEADGVLEKFKDRIPIIVEKAPSCKIEIEKVKYLVPSDMVAQKFMQIIRQKLKLNETQSLYFFVGGKHLLKGDTILS